MKISENQCLSLIHISEILVQRDREVQMAVNEFGKGRSVYISGLPYRDVYKRQVLTDIQGLEDHFGDMDFKVAGTRDGITALQMDIKIQGITAEILTEALAQAKKARFEILDVIEATIPEVRPELAPTAPKIDTIKIDVDKIKIVIGKGGETIDKICLLYTSRCV